LKDVSLADANAAACATKSGTFVNFSSKSFTNANNQAVQVTVSGQGNHNDNIFQVGERFVYTCAEPNTQANYTNSVTASGTGIVSGVRDNDTDNTQIVVSSTPSILVVKEDANSNDEDGRQFNDTQTVQQ